MRSFALTALAFAAGVFAQNQTIQVQVGGNETSTGGIFQFIPNNINATAGSTITFEFTGNPGNHSITQSSFADPCNPLAGGFDSGWVLIATALPSAPTWTLTITNDSTPIWFYCKQLVPSPHCAAGMVGAINAPTSGSNTFAAYQAAAEAFKGTPGQEVGALIGQGASASAPPSLVSGATLFGTPSATAPSGAASATTASASGTATSGNSASALQVNSVVALLATFMGIALA